MPSVAVWSLGITPSCCIVSCNRRVMVPSCWNTSGETASESGIFRLPTSSIFIGRSRKTSGRRGQLLHDLLHLLLQRGLGEGLDDVAGRARLRREDDVL